MMPLFVDAVSRFRSRDVPQPRQSDWPYYMPYLRDGSIDLADGLSASYATIYRGQPWVWAAVNKLAKSVARMSMKAYEQDGQQRNRIYDGRLAELMRRPSVGMTPFQFKERLVKNVAIYGNHIVVKLGADDQGPVELFPAPAVGWAVGEGDTYVWTSRTGDKYPFKREQIIHYRYWDFDDNGFGISMLEPLRNTLALEDAARRFGLAAFKNGARPSSVLRTDQTLKPQTADRLVAEMTAIHGGVDNAFKVAVLQQGLDWAPIPASDLEEAALVEHRKLNKEEVAAVFDLPQPTIGILDEANFASVEMFHTMLYQDSLGPWVVMIEETTQEELVYPTPAFSGQFVEFDMHSVMRGNDSDQYRNYATAIQTGFMTPNEVRARENLPPSSQPQADQLLFPLNLSGAVGAQQAEDSGQEDDTDVGA